MKANGTRIIRWHLTNSVAIAAFACAAGALFLLDMLTPPGVADGVGYAGVMVLCLWMKSPKASVVCAIVLTCLVILGGLMIGLIGGVGVASLVNRFLAVLCIWAVAFLLTRRKEFEADIQKAAEEARSDRRHNLFSVAEEVFSSAPVAIGLYRGDGTCILANDAYAGLVGATKESLLAQNFHHIGSWWASGLLDAALRTLATGEPQRIEFDVLTTFGRRIWARSEFARISHGTEPLLLLLANDLTELKQREQELAGALHIAQESNSAQSRFLASVSHELRTPLNAILGFSEMLGMSSMEAQVQRPPRTKEYADDIHHSAKYLLSLIDDILDMSRLLHGTYEIDSIAFDAVPVIMRAVALCKHAIDAKQQIATTKFSDASLTIKGDSRLFQQCLVNLLSNSAKFTNSGGHIGVELGRKSGLIYVAVTDTGIGIPADELPHLGQPFRQAVRRDGKLFSGTGLGLAITKALTEKQGGLLVVESIEGQGTTVRMEFPTD